MISILGFILGAIAGSAATALADRYEEPRSFLIGRSQCPHCHRTLHWFELIPIVSWLIQRGRCRQCQWPIGWEVLAIELGSAVVAAFVLSQFEPSTAVEVRNLVVSGVALFGSLVGLGALTLVDLETQQLPDRLILGTLPFLLVLGILSPAIHLALASALLGLLAGGGSLLLIWLATRGRGIGLGDVKLMASLGLGLGWPATLVALWWASILGGLVAGWLLATGRAKFGAGTTVAFGPLLILGYALALLWGRSILTWFGIV